MSLTKIQYVDAVIRLGREQGISITQADAESSLPNALNALSDLVMSDGRASLLQRRFRVTYTGATFDGPFSTIKLDDGATLASVLIANIKTDTISVVKYDDGAGTVTTFHRVPGDSEIDFERNAEFAFYDPYVILDAKIRAKKADQSTLADGFLSFQANWVPGVHATTFLIGLPSSGELDSDLVMQGVGICAAAETGVSNG